MHAALLLLTCLAERPPDASDLIRFPDHETASRCYYEAQEAQRACTQRYYLSPPDSWVQHHWGAAAHECEILAETWLALSRAHLFARDSCCAEYARQLKARLPPLAWRTGRMPPSIPTWRFAD